MLDKSLKLHGGAGRDRTAGLLVANEALSQLSYSPIKAVVILEHLVSLMSRLETEDRSSFLH